MEDRILLRANLKRHKGGLFGVLILMLFTAAALGTVLIVWTNSTDYISNEMQRAGFGTMTAWVSGLEHQELLADEILELPEIDRVEIQEVFFSNYEANGIESDSEGQLILYHSKENRYRFFTDDLHGYEEGPSEISAGEIYVSPSMISILNLSIGDEIHFLIARAGIDAVFEVAGFYEDPFMGSSMIGMKGFLIGKEDFEIIRRIVQESGIDALAREGAMFHIFEAESGNFTASWLNQLINDHTSLSMYTEFTHSERAIAGFMLVLQNAFSGLLLAFVLVLLFVVIIVLGHSISSGIETDYTNMGILKTVGFTGEKLRKLQLMQYLIAILGGMVFGLLLSVPLSKIVSSATLTTTGILIPSRLPVRWCVLSFGAILIILILFISRKTRSIQRIAPMKAIRGDMRSTAKGSSRQPGIFGKYVNFELAIRQIVTGKRMYAGACMVAVLLVFFASMIGRMNSWLGPDGKGMMDAFNPADHDLGVQVLGNLTAAEAENTIREFTDITDTYLLAMPSVAVNGVDYTVNVISEPDRFHILEGKTCSADNEIVVTEFVAADLGVAIGDTLRVEGDSGSAEYLVSGIYSCANDMGKNIGMSQEGYFRIGQDNPHLWCYHYFLADSSQKTAITQVLEEMYGGDVHVHENTWPGLLGIISAMKALMIVLYVAVAIFILVVTVLTGSKILAAEQQDIGIYKALGFQDRQLMFSFALRFGLVALPGSCIGLVLATWLTNPLVSGVMKLAGISNFSSSPGYVSILLPALIVVVLFIIFAYLAAGKIKKVDISVLITE